MAVLTTPKLLLLDEHTAALDPRDRGYAVMRATIAAVERDRLTTLMVTHNMEHALAYGNRLGHDERKAASSYRQPPARRNAAADGSKASSSASTSPATACCWPDMTILNAYLNLVPVTLMQSVIYAFAALGIMIPFRLLAFPDLTVEGSFPFGGCVAAALIASGVDPALATLAAICAGVFAGVITAAIHLTLRLNTLLCGILVLTMLFSINIRQQWAGLTCRCLPIRPCSTMCLVL